MSHREKRKLVENLTKTNPKRRIVGGIEIPRQVPPEKKLRQKKVLTTDEMPQLVKKMVHTTIPRPAFNSEPSMPGFRSFSNSRRKKNTKAPYPAEF